MQEIEIMTPYEFEDRAKFFMAEVEVIAEKYTSLNVEVENNTLANIEANGQVVTKLIEMKNTFHLEKIYRQGYNYEIESAMENKVFVTIYSLKKKAIYDFGNKIDKLAKNYIGVKEPDDIGVWDIGEEGPDQDYRFYASFIYVFK